MAAVQRIYVTISLQPQTEGGATEYMPVTRYIERTEQKLACPAHGHTSNVASPTKKPCVRQSRNLEIFGALVRSLSSRYLPHARLDTFRMLICAVAYAISRCDSDYYGLSAYYSLLWPVVLSPLQYIRRTTEGKGRRKSIDQRRVDVSTGVSKVSCNEMCVSVRRSVCRSVDVFFIWVCRCSVLKR